MNHSPAPWRQVVRPDNKTVVRYIVAADNSYVATVESETDSARNAYAAPNRHAGANAAVLTLAPQLREFLEAFVLAADGPRDRFGRLTLRLAEGEPLRELAIRYQVGGAVDTTDQAVKVAKALLVTSQIEVRP